MIIRQRTVFTLWAGIRSRTATQIETNAVTTVDALRTADD